MDDNVFPQQFVNHGVAPRKAFALYPNQAGGGSVLDPACGDLGQQRRGHPAIYPQDAVDAQGEACRRTQVPRAQSGHDGFGKTGAVKPEIRQEAADGRRPFLKQWHIDVVFYDIDAVELYPKTAGGAAVLDPACGVLGQQRRGQPAIYSQDAVDAQGEACLRTQVPRAQSGHDGFGKTGAVKPEIRQEAADGRRPFLKQWPIDVVFYDIDAVALGNAGDASAALFGHDRAGGVMRSEEHTSELQSLMRISYAVFCLKKKTKRQTKTIRRTHLPVKQRETV